MLTKLKERIQALLVTEARLAHEVGLTPNMISVAGMILAFLSALAYAGWYVNRLYLLLAAFLFLLSGFCDVLDGVLARIYQKTTAFGGFLDSMLDRYADAIVYSGIILSGLCDALWGLAALIGSLLVSYSRARAKAVGIETESIGLGERAERMIILATATIIAIFWTLSLNIAIILLAALSNLTALHRILYVYKKLGKTKSS